MRRVRLRHLVTICCALSLVVLLFTAWLWCRSFYRFEDRIGYGRMQADQQTVRVRGIESARGRLRLFRMDAPAMFSGFATELEGFTWAEFPQQSGSRQAAAAFSVIRGKYGYAAVVVPHAAVVAAAGVMPAVSVMRGVRRVRAQRRGAHGLCPTCGYDLRAHEAGERCPECGTGVKA